MIDLYEIPSLVLCAVLIVALLGSIEIGQIIGRRTREADWDATSGAFLPCPALQWPCWACCSRFLSACQ